MRGQLGAIEGAKVQNLPADFQFYSGGGGTVRGQSYRSIAEKLTSQMIAFGDLKGSQDEEELAELDEVISKEG